MFLKTLSLFLTIKLSLFACADYWDPTSINYMFLEKKDNIFLEYSEDLNDAAIYNTILWEYEKKNKEENLKEWQKELKNQYSIEQIEDFLYNKNLINLENSDIKEYINFVQSQEECANSNSFNDIQSRCSNFVSKALKKLEASKSEFLKQRYFFLALRLAHYYKQNPIEIYKKYYSLLENSNSIAKSWVDALYAGALVKNGQKADGVYMFTKLFPQSINSHLALYNFFHIRNDNEFLELLNLAKTNEEKEKFYALRALDSASNSIEEMQNIYNLDKNSKWLEFLMYRELLKSQIFFNTYDYFDESSENKNLFYDKYINFLNSLELENSYLKNLSLVYFNIYKNDFIEANRVLDSLLEKNRNSHEVQTVSYILYLNSLESINKKDENVIIEKIEKLIDEKHTSNAIYDYTLDVLSKLYKKQGLDFNLFLATNSQYIDYTTLDLEKFKVFEEFLSKPQDSKLKTYLQTRFKNLIDNDGEFSYAKITLLINNLKFKEALQTNLKTLDYMIEYNPFNGLIRGNNRSGKKEQLSIKEFLEKMIEIEAILNNNPNSSMDNFLYANALYNLSYFGSASKITTTYRSVMSVHTPNLQEQKLKLALKHYELAFSNSQEKELKAKILYQMSKTKLALFDLSSSQNGYPQSLAWGSNGKKKYYYGDDENIYINFLQQDGAKYFDELKNSYSNTKYYKELLKECGDFRTYINNK